MIRSNLNCNKEAFRCEPTNYYFY